jgi:hypothetical protein
MNNDMELRSGDWIEVEMRVKKKKAVNRSVCGREDGCNAIKVAALESKFLCICRQPSSHSSPVESAV